MDKDFIQDVKDQRCLSLPTGDNWEEKLDKIKVPELYSGLRVYWYYKDDAEFSAQFRDDPRVDPPYSGLIIPLPDVEIRGGHEGELEWEDCIVVIDSYPTEKCYPEVDWVALGRLLDNDNLVEIY